MNNYNKRDTLFPILYDFRVEFIKLSRSCKISNTCQKFKSFNSLIFRLNLDYLRNEWLQKNTEFNIAIGKKKNFYYIKKKTVFNL
jgi:hypothetical protein